MANFACAIITFQVMVFALIYSYSVLEHDQFPTVSTALRSVGISCDSEPLYDDVSAGVVLRYFDARGRAEVIRLALEHTEVPYSEEKYTKATWPANKKAGMEKGWFTFGQVPNLQTSSGRQLVQSVAILKHIAARKGLRCTAEQETQCDIVSMGAEDIRTKLSKEVYTSTFSAASRAAFYNDIAPVWLQHLEKLLPAASSSTPVFISSHSLTWVDLLVFDTLDYLRAVAAVPLPSLVADPLAPFPRLTAFAAHVSSQPRIAAYLASDRRRPYNLPYPPKEN